ncbi:RNA 3'-terminal phosphate cyclase [Tahibacter amnicola]|uniref:RNA 3'-terminal phosphate cyclase n=1 Tax=Tahibacter amnicola TaxID=2976241 RepID=A0ABY6BCS1_9GAMM|nr:RNA 3'-terminal phosphate cyclase [Tahibacter amnicola]UXI67836.1 RNA 3'-terminal phosphate cyclase [Tahibacter amnicola]
MSMIELDGSAGGGQLLRTALSLSLCTSTPFRMSGIRAGRSRPGLMRQHLTAVEAARRIGNAHVLNAAPGSTELVFEPGVIVAGDFHFAVGTAGSTMLVLQTALPALLQADAASTLRVEGGTHNPLAPPADFLQHAFLPQLARMGGSASVNVVRHGFAPAGGGLVELAVTPSSLQQITLCERGAVRQIRATALLSGLDSSIGEREVRAAARRLPMAESDLEVRQVRPALGPGNALLITVHCEHVSVVFTGFGERGKTAEQVAADLCADVQRYLDSGAATDTHLGDQLLLPMALAGGGRFTTTESSDHLRTNAAMIEKFLPVEVTILDRGPQHFEVSIQS